MDEIATMWLDLPLKGNRNYLQGAAIWEQLALHLLNDELEKGNRADIEAGVLHLRFRRAVRCAAKVNFSSSAVDNRRVALVTGRLERYGAPSAPEITIMPTNRALSRRIPEDDNAFVDHLRFDGNSATISDIPNRNLADLYAIAGKALVARISEPGISWVVTSFRLPLLQATQKPSRIQLTITHMARGSSRGVCDIHAYGLCHPGGRLLFMRAPIGWQGGS